ncbi:arginine repressor [Dermatophilus congolensis]|nr:arginine repressor [Dermatophilus congolensis]MBO3218109.1 arginine repressor [Dermatophilus congolensis]
MDMAARTKAARHRLIARIISATHIHSQRELSKSLEAHGVIVTQATLSRDLKEMRATKMRAAGGAQVYVIPEAGAPGQMRLEDGSGLTSRFTQRLCKLTADLVVSIAYAHTDVVLQTPPGAAQLLASAIDDAMLPGVLGTVAGNDTILIPAIDEESAARIAHQFVHLSSAEAPNNGRINH